MSKLLKVALVLLTIEWTTAYHYNNFPYYTGWEEAPRYPDWCCPLEWTNMTQGQELPKDWIKAGTFMDRDFAFTRSVPYFYTAVKSSNPGDLAYAYGYGYTISSPFPILTNPNKCKLDWYTTKYLKEIPPTNFDTFYPTTGHTPYGSYAQYQNIPGWMGGAGDFARMKSLTNYDFDSVSDVKLLYVDCINSVRSMSKSKLIDLTINQSEIGRVKSSSSKVVHVKKVFTNRSPEKSEVTFKFSVLTADTINVTVQSNHSSLGDITADTYSEWVDGQRINKFLSEVKLGGEKSRIKIDSFQVDSDPEAALFGSYHQRQSDFEQKVTLPAMSKITVTAYSNPVVRTLPLKAVYELTPIKAGDNLINANVLNATLSRYGMQKSIKITDRGSVLVTFDGLMTIYSGNEVHLDIVSTPIDDRSESTGFPINVTMV